MGECVPAVNIFGNDGEARSSMHSSNVAAWAAARSAVPAAALSAATQQALKKHPCPKACPHLRIGSLVWTITSVKAKRLGFFHLVASLFTWSWKWEGIAKFSWRAKRHCHNKPLRKALIGHANGEEEEKSSGEPV
ncbi:hypothetical protein KAW55_05795 [bacterium]|nr:hypothetical protein [bacterium]